MTCGVPCRLLARTGSSFQDKHFVPDAFLSKILSHGASGADADYLAAHCRGPLPVKARSDILDGEAPCDALSILLEGWACKYQIMTNGRRQIVYVHLPGDVCNLDSLQRPSLASGVAAMSVCKIATLSVAWLRTAIGERPTIRDLFLSLTVAENVAMTNRVASLGGHSSRQRVAHFLLDLLSRLEAVGPAPLHGLRLPLTRQDIGDALGLSTIHVSRIFQSLREGGLVATKGRTYTIRDRGALQALADDEAKPRRRSSGAAARPAPR